MGADYSAINSAYDLSLSQVDHWCVRGDNDSCRCEDPLEPSPRSEFKSWVAAHKANVAEVNLYRALYGDMPSMIDEEGGKPRAKIDVAFLGESVVEAMDGRWLGKHIIGKSSTRQQQQQQQNSSSGKNFPMINETFEKIFRKDKGGELEGVALGIAGDTTSNVLWRIMNDEMPYDFNPKVWWLVLGMNDLTRMQCSEEIVVLGVLRVVEEIRLRKPDAKIVINSLLPMINYQDGSVEPKMADVADFTGDRINNKKYNRKEDRYREERKREVPASFKVRGGNDDEVGDRDGKRKRRLLRFNHRLLRLKQKEDETDADFEERRTKKMDKKKERREKLTKKQKEEVEDNATEGPDLEKAIERKKKKLDKEDKKIRDKAFKDDEKYHPKKSVSKFLPMIKKKVLPPVWPSVHLINDKLKEFCTKHDSITFFDATEFFASKEEGGRHHLYNDLISPRGHPTELGFQRWELEIRDRLQQLIPPEPDLPEVATKIPLATGGGGEDDDGGMEGISDGATVEEDTDDALPEEVPARSFNKDDEDDEATDDEADVATKDGEEGE